MRSLLAAALALGLASPGLAQTASPGGATKNDAAPATQNQQKPASQPQQQVPGPTPQETSRAEKPNPAGPLDQAPQSGPQAGSSSTTAENPANGKSDDRKKER
jgi:hypothetical protein